jgi:hypothetical protein
VGEVANARPDPEAALSLAHRGWTSSTTQY